METQAPPATAPPRRRRGLLAAGLVLLAAGAVLLGYVGWELWGTNVVSEHRQRQLVERTRQAWRQPATSAPSGGTDAGPGPAQALVRIPRFGAGYVVPVQEGVSEQVLAEGFGHFPGTAGPGRVGNYALAGHRITHGQPLRDMPELRPGDRVIVETRRTTFTYVLDTNPNALVVPFTDVWVLSPHPRDPAAGGVQPAPQRRLITLTTCSELFHTDNRMIAFGHLVAARPRT